MVVREAGPEDVALLAELGSYVQAIHHQRQPDVFRPPDVLGAVPFYRQLLEDISVTGYLAEDGDGQAIGFVIVRVVESAGTPMTWPATVVEVEQIGVAPDVRRRGVGSELMATVHQFARRVAATRLQLTVWEFNHDAQRFFEARGLQTTVLRMVAPVASTQSTSAS